MARNLRLNIPPADHLWIYDIDLKASHSLASAINGNVTVAMDVPELARYTVRERLEEF